MTDALQSYTFSDYTRCDGDVFPNAPRAVEVSLTRTDAVSLAREASALLAKDDVGRSLEIPVRREGIRWLQLPSELGVDIDEATDFNDEFAQIRYECFALVALGDSVDISVRGREKHTSAEVFSEITSLGDLMEKFQISDDEVQPRMFLVQGEDFTVPGRITHLCPTMDLAQEHALDLVNTIREGIELPPVTDVSKWEEALQEAKQARADEFGTTLDDEEVVKADVWIDEIPMMTAAPADLVALRAAETDRRNARVRPR